MGLRDLADGLSKFGRRVVGVQAHGLNAGETPDTTIAAMAARDVAEIQERQPSGPYTLVGYSFGARIAYETAFQLEQRGEVVDNLFLIAPGSPTLTQRAISPSVQSPTFDNPDYVSVLLSVFTRQLGGPELVQCLQRVGDSERFKEFAKKLVSNVPPTVVERIVEVSMACLNMTYRPNELSGHNVQAPITVLKAAGDDKAFIEDKSFMPAYTPNYQELPCDHYRLLTPYGVDMLTCHIISQIEFINQLDIAA